MTTTTTQLTTFIEKVKANFNTIDEERKQLLEPLQQFISEKLSYNESVNLVFICTHNSRRSHFTQIWAQVAAAHYGFNSVTTYSGGTEVTALYPSVLAALTSNGLKIEKQSGDDSNPHYAIHYSDEHNAIDGFSKLYDSTENPDANFAAIMTCAHAEANCPFIPNAGARIAVPYIDPKVSDGTPDEAEHYQAKSKEIATELFYVFDQLSKISNAQA